MSQVTEQIFLGSYQDVNQAVVTEFGITCVMNMTIEVDDVVFPGVENARYELHDIPQGDIPPVLQAAAGKIDEVVRGGGKILVHCVRGISRSAAACLVYFITYTGLTLREAFVMLKSRRHIVRPHTGFWRCMLDLEKSLKGKATVKLLVYPMSCVPDVYRDTGVIKSRHLSFIIEVNNMDTNTDFCTELRQKTQKIHDQSDKLINLKLAVVLTDTKLWAGVLADFYEVYRTIEEAMARHKDHPRVAPLIFDELLRTKAFEKDLLFYLGSDWKQVVQPSVPARCYCDRIWEIADQDPTLLVAYAHNMYLALLAGGQIIKRIVKRTLGLHGEAGLAVFEFDEDVAKRQIKNLFKENINRLELTREEKDLIIAEKIRSFQMNNAIANNVKPTLSSFKRLAMLLVLVILFFCAVIGMVVILSK